MVPLEKTVLHSITRLLLARGAYRITTTGVSCVGTPDIVACYHGRFLGIEVKRELDGKYGVTPKQQHELGKISKAGGYAIVAYGVFDVIAVLDDIDALVLS